jgi:hypothetical protein
MERNPVNVRHFSIAVFGSLLAGTALFAQAFPPGASPSLSGRGPQEERRLQRQQKRTPQGIVSGPLAPKEAARLEHQGAKFNLNTAITQGNGSFAKQEPAKHFYEQNPAYRRVIRQKHDAKNVK